MAWDERLQESPTRKFESCPQFSCHECENAASTRSFLTEDGYFSTVANASRYHGGICA